MPVVFPVLLLVVLGALLAAFGGPLAVPGDLLLSVVHRTGESWAGDIGGALLGAGAGVDVAAAVAGAVTPGLLCLLLVETLGASLRRRLLAVLVMLLGSMAAFVAVPAGAAAGLLATAVLLGALVTAASGWLLTGPIAVLTGYLVGAFTAQVLRGSSRDIDRYAAALGDFVPLGGWLVVVVSAVALAPVLRAAHVLLRPGD